MSCWANSFVSLREQGELVIFAKTDQYAQCPKTLEYGKN